MAKTTKRRYEQAMSSAAALRARSLRNNASPPERQLWHFLRTLRKEGYHFRRQAPLRGYFLDFVCYSHRLVIEVDGSQHGTEGQAEHDALSDKVLSREGFSTLRFPAISSSPNCVPRPAETGRVSRLGFWGRGIDMR